MFGGISAETISWQRRVVEAQEIGLWCKFENLSCQGLSGTRWGLDFPFLGSPVIIREERRGLLRPCPKEATAPQGRPPPSLGPLTPLSYPCFQIAGRTLEFGSKTLCVPYFWDVVQPHRTPPPPACDNKLDSLPSLMFQLRKKLKASQPLYW